MKILLIYQHEASFVKDDLDLLAELGDVVAFPFGSYKAKEGLRFSTQLMRQAAWLNRNLPTANLVVGWFVDYHMLLPVRKAKAFGKPTAVCVGGFDANRVPSLSYGLFENKWRAKIARSIYRDVSIVLPVAESLLQSENEYSEYPDILRTGIKENVPDFDRPVQVLPTGYDPGQWPLGTKQREKVVLSVAAVSSMRTFRLKGLDLVLEAAQLLPDFQFRIVGLQPEIQKLVHQRYLVSKNVVFRAPVPRRDLVSEYQSASVFLHLSRAEGMPNVICEAMLCGCYPVVSNVFGNPAAVGPCGFLIDKPHPDAICRAIENASGAGDEQRLACRRHISSKFSRSHRKHGWSQVISRLCK